MNQKKINIKNWIVAVSTALSCHISSAHGEIVMPEKLNQMVTQAITIKVESMKHPDPRKDDTFYNSFANIIDKIGETEIEKSVWNDVINNQQDDIRLKIIVWAKDRATRRDDYHLFAKTYVNEPLTKDDVIWLWKIGMPDKELTEDQKNSALNARYLNPLRVPKKDLLETNRAMIEYHFYAPFTRSGNVSDFIADAVKPGLLSDLQKLGDIEKSKIMWIDCINTGLAVEESIGGEFNKKHIIHSIWMLARFPKDESFLFISKHWENAVFRECLTEYLKVKFTSYDSVDLYDSPKEFYGKWQVLAAKDWQNPLEKAFAEWLKKQTPPPLPPKPKHSK